MKHLTRLPVTIVLLLLAAISQADTGAEPRQSLTAQGKDIPRGHVSSGTYNEHEALKLEEQATADGKDTKVMPRAGAVVQDGDPNFWIYDVDVELFSDADRDGYYWGIDLMFDADTYYDVAEVYAVLYLSYEYGPWNEYATTEDITLFGSSAVDDYVVESELVSGYPTGHYDILVELYDAWDGTFLASIGPEDTSELSLLPLEDSSRDATSSGGTQVVVSSGGGGAFGWLLLFGLLAVRMTLRPQAARLSK